MSDGPARETPPRILYKYCPPSALGIFDSLAIKVTRPTDFNDPFEFMPTTGGEVHPYDVLRVMETGPRFDNPVLRERQLKFLMQGLQTAFEKSTEEFAKMVGSSSGVFCVSEVSDSVLMWSHYSDNHRGFVLGIDRAALGDLNWRRVRYEPERVQFDAVNYLRPGSEKGWDEIERHKAPGWSYEKEWRAILNWSSPKLSWIDVNGSRCKGISIPDAIAEVWLGVRCSPRTEEKIREALKVKAIDVEPRRYRLDDREYKLI